jgi:DNA-binding CsgD family transcriptional regulator/PAS domain-containing protein
MRALGETDVLDLIDGIYEAGMSFERWPDALTAVADAFGAQDASLGTMAPHGLPWIFAPRTDPDFMRAYAEAYHPLDQVWHGVTRQGVGRPATDAMVLPRNELEKSAFHNEWSRPQGYRTIMGEMVLAEQGWRTVLMLPGREAFEAEDLRVLATLTRHIRRAVQLNIRLAQGDLNQGTTAQALAQMAAAAFLLDGDGRVLFANGAAEALFRRGRGVRVSQGRLSAARTEDAADLAAMIGRCALSGTEERGGVLTFGEGAAPLTLQFLPVRETPLLAPGLACAMVFDTTHKAPADPAQRLRAVYGLTAAEAALALEIAKGDGKRAAAERRGVSFATARTHLSRIFEKTGVNRQAELVRLILTETGPAPEKRSWADDD